MHDEPITWNQRMAAELCAADTLTEGMVEAILEAAGEMKAVGLKIMLARCQEAIEALSDGENAQTYTEMVDEIREALK